MRRGWEKLCLKLKNRIVFAIDCKYNPVFFAYGTIAFHDGNNPK